MQKILVGYDDTDPSKRALERAAELARAFDAKVVVTSVAPLLHGTARSAGPVDPTDSPAMHEEQLKNAAAVLSGQGITPELIPATGEPAAAIARLADEVDADLVVVGTREPTVAERVLRASVSRKVASRVHRDLLIVHPGH
jgi:nucleotide-binding universal stress UspA family protein